MVVSEASLALVPLHAVAINPNATIAAARRIDLLNDFTEQTLARSITASLAVDRGVSSVFSCATCGPRLVASWAMKTRTLLLLSVGTALMILLAGGVLLFQLSSQDSTTAPTRLGVVATIGDANVTVQGSNVIDGVLRVHVDIAGVDDPDGISSFRLVTGDQRLDPIMAPSEGRCATMTVEPQSCLVDFDVSASEGSSRVLVVRRGEEQSTWRLS